MGLFDALTGNVNTRPIRRAGAIEAAAYPQAAGQLTTSTGQAVGTLTDAQKQAIAAQQAAAGQGTGYLQTGLQQALGQLGTGYGAAQGDINQALGLYSPLAGITGGAEQMYANALGLGGQAGTQAALGAFQQGPGYQYQLGQGLDALQREANSRGMLASGNLSQDELAYSQNLANQGWQNWLGQLGGLGAQAPGIAGAQAGLYGQLAGLNTGLGQQQAGLTEGTYGGLANIASGLGSNLSNLYTGTGQEVAGMQGQLGTQLAGLDLGQAQSRAQTLANVFNAQQQAGQNATNFWGNLLAGGMGLAGRIYGSQPTATV